MFILIWNGPLWGRYLSMQNFTFKIVLTYYYLNINIVLVNIFYNNKIDDENTSFMEPDPQRAGDLLQAGVQIIEEHHL
jgi:uncharacterized protein YcgI (DUF1989 family)